MPHLYSVLASLTGQELRYSSVLSIGLPVGVQGQLRSGLVPVGPELLPHPLQVVHQIAALSIDEQRNFGGGGAVVGLDEVSERGGVELKHSRQTSATT